MSNEKLKVGDKVLYGKIVSRIIQVAEYSDMYLIEFLDNGKSFWVDCNKVDLCDFKEINEELKKEMESISNIRDIPISEKKSPGTKNDAGKPRISLIPKDAIWGIARGLSYGEKKYGTHNFRNGIEYSRLADACLRHLTAWLECENIDSESGNSHLDHALASLAMLKFMEVHRPEMDDRWGKDAGN